jgi:hypothetical protein
MPAALAPRLLTAEEAAEYCGRIPVAEFKRVAWGRTPVGKSVRYDRYAIDAKLDALHGLRPNPASPAGSDFADDAEAALDRFIGP